MVINAKKSAVLCGKLKVANALLMALCVAYPLKASAQNVTLHDYFVSATDPILETGAPLSLQYQRLHFVNNSVIKRDLDIVGPLIAKVAANQSAHINSRLHVSSTPFINSVYKLGQGNLVLSGHNRLLGGIVVAEGGLAITSLEAAYNGLPQFVMMPGTRLEFADGLNVANSILMLKAEQNAIKDVWGQALSTAPSANDLSIHIPNGDVYHTGIISIDAEYSLQKTGLGNLHFEGHMGGLGIRGEFHIREGSFTVHNRSTGFITVHNGATIRSRGHVVDLQLKDGARLETYSPTDTFSVWKSLRLSPRSVAHIWLNNNQSQAPLVFDGDVQLDGILMVSLSADFAKQYPYTVVSAPNGYKGRFAELIFTNPHADMPSLQYEPTAVLLTYYNDKLQPVPPPKPKVKTINSQVGTYNQVNAQQLADSRFLREAVATTLWDNAANNRLTNGVWARVLHADLHQNTYRSAWEQQRRTEGLFIGGDSGQQYALRYGGQLGLQPSRWYSPRAQAQASWNSYTVGASISSQETDTVAWHVGAGYSHSRTQHQRTALQTAISSKNSQHLWQLYGEARPKLYGYNHQATPQWQQPSTQLYGIGQFIQLYQPTQNTTEYWQHQGSLQLKHRAATATVMGLGIGLQHHYLSENGNTTANLRLIRQQALAGSTLSTEYRHANTLLQGNHLSTGKTLSAWQLDLNIQGQIAKHSHVGIDLSQRYARKRIDSTINLQAEMTF